MVTEKKSTAQILSNLLFLWFRCLAQMPKYRLYISINVCVSSSLRVIQSSRPCRHIGVEAKASLAGVPNLVSIPLFMIQETANGYCGRCILSEFCRKGVCCHVTNAFQNICRNADKFDLFLGEGETNTGNTEILSVQDLPAMLRDHGPRGLRAWVQRKKLTMQMAEFKENHDYLEEDAEHRERENKTEKERDEEQKRRETAEHETQRLREECQKHKEAVEKSENERAHEENRNKERVLQLSKQLDDLKSLVTDSEAMAKELENLKEKSQIAESNVCEEQEASRKEVEARTKDCVQLQAKVNEMESMIHKAQVEAQEECAKMKDTQMAEERKRNADDMNLNCKRARKDAECEMEAMAKELEDLNEKSRIVERDVDAKIKAARNEERETAWKKFEADVRAARFEEREVFRNEIEERTKECGQLRINVKRNSSTTPGHMQIGIPGIDSDRVNGACPSPSTIHNIW